MVHKGTDLWWNWLRVNDGVINGGLINYKPATTKCYNFGRPPTTSPSEKSTPSALLRKSSTAWSNRCRPTILKAEPSPSSKIELLSWKFRFRTGESLPLPASSQSCNNSDRYTKISIFKEALQLHRKHLEGLRRGYRIDLGT